MNEEELYKLAITDVPKYSLLNEILAIRDKRFPDEETDYTINVYGSVSLDVLNKYVDLVNNWNELKKWAEEEIIECKAIINTILPEFEKIMPRSSGKTLLANEYNKHQTIIKSFEVMLNKMQELENRKV
jgi:hypothetical protein